ncbi:hypothetical protein E5288_WYG007555 [Bos mutus]|uniref:Uncharacterized protein n=1 Tax=Bos mutus TaxID=72004 RepID=A0A6B0REJ7_9CETA|nr:hypothetical protein [Bos mutus]
MLECLTRSRRPSKLAEHEDSAPMVRRTQVALVRARRHWLRMWKWQLVILILKEAESAERKRSDFQNLAASLTVYIALEELSRTFLTLEVPLRRVTPSALEIVLKFRPRD